MLPSTSALSASSAAISSMIFCGLRCAISSPPLGFFTETHKLWTGTFSIVTQTVDRHFSN